MTENKVKRRIEIQDLLSQYKGKIKKLKAKKNPSKKKYGNTRLLKYAAKLEKNLPKSERWFRKKWLDLFQNEINSNTDKYNEPLGKYIPDVVNHVYNYVIEIDGSVHNLETVKWKDSLKTKYYTKLGYKVYRITAYDDEQFNIVYNEIKTLRR